MYPELIIFDVDDTLTLRYKHRIYHWARDFFSGVGASMGAKFALASNQGGVGMRYWMETANFGRPEDRPTAEEAEKRLEQVALTITQLSGREVRVYVAFAYQAKRTGKWSPIPPGCEDDPRWSPDWRKPNPGMMLAAAADWGVDPAQCLVVGDNIGDANNLAARKAGMAFIEAGKFFTNIEAALDIRGQLTAAVPVQEAAAALVAALKRKS